jgi:hypothetical protein
MRLVILFYVLMLAGCISPDKGEVYELTVESCYAMLNDKEHGYWKNDVTVQSCELLIMEYEEANLAE